MPTNVTPEQETDKYTRCPKCSRKSVYWAARRNGEDNYSCRHSDCDFYFYTSSGSPIDAEREQQWKDVNSLPLTSEVRVTCTCGHSDTWDRFARDEDCRDLPPNEWRCPACRTHVRLGISRDNPKWPKVSVNVVRSGRKAA